MKLKPITNYSEVKYPTLEEYLKEKGQISKKQQLMIATASAALAVLMSGCGAVS